MADAFIDLHCHTTYSDGSFEPEEVVAQAVAAGVATLSITDHDEVGYWPRAKAAADEAGIGLIPGVELSVKHRGKEVHILGYGFDPLDQDLIDALLRFKNARRERAHRILGKLADLGMPMELDDVVPPDFNGAIARPHFARALHRQGYVSTVQEAFDLYLGNGKPAAEEKVLFLPEDACAMIRDAGGVSSIAHPVLCNAKEWLGELVDTGLDGVEVLHSAHSEGDRRTYGQLAERFGLLKTGGCDFHGAAKPNVFFGDVQVPMEWLAPLETAIAGVQAGAGRRT